MRYGIFQIWQWRSIKKWTKFTSWKCKLQLRSTAQTSLKQMTSSTWFYLYVKNFIHFCYVYCELQKTKIMNFNFKCFTFNHIVQQPEYCILNFNSKSSSLNITFNFKYHNITTQIFTFNFKSNNLDIVISISSGNSNIAYLISSLAAWTLTFVFNFMSDSPDINLKSCQAVHTLHI